MSETPADQVSDIPEGHIPEGHIPETMRAVICHGPENYQLEEVAVPKPGPGEALIQVEATGICASDLKCYHGAAKFWGTRTVLPGRKPRSSQATSSSEKWFSWMTKPPIVGESRLATVLSPSRSCRAGNVATA